MSNLDLNSLANDVLPAIKVTVNWALLGSGISAWLAAVLPQATAGGIWWVIRTGLDLIGGNVGNAKNQLK